MRSGDGCREVLCKNRIAASVEIYGGFGDRWWIFLGGVENPTGGGFRMGFLWQKAKGPEFGMAGAQVAEHQTDLEVVVGDDGWRRGCVRGNVAEGTEIVASALGREHPKARDLPCDDGAEKKGCCRCGNAANFADPLCNRSSEQVDKWQ